MIYLLNILSPGTTPANIDIAEIARTSGPVDIIGTAAGRKLGSTVRYWMEGADLWAEADIDETGACLDAGPRSHAESVLATDRDGKTVRLMAVIITRLPRGMLQSAASFIEAVKLACESKLGSRGPAAAGKPS